MTMMKTSFVTLAAAFGALSLLTACTSASEPSSPSNSAPATHAPTTSSPAPPPTTQDATAPEERVGVVGTIVRFTSAQTTVDVTIAVDTPAVRDFLSMLPLTVDVEELGGREKIAYLPRELAHGGTPGSDPENGDLIYYTPWANLGFYYDASGIGYTDQTLHLGTYQADRAQLDLLEGSVTIEVPSEG